MDKKIISIPFKKEKISLSEIGRIAMFIIPILVIVFFVIINRGDLTSSDLGTFGDFIGGVANPIFGFLSFIALLYTIVLQSKELELTRKELEETKKEIQRSAEAQELSSKVFQQQQFDSTFFSLLEQINGSTEVYMKQSSDEGGQNKFLQSIDNPIIYSLKDFDIAIWKLYKENNETRGLIDLFIDSEREQLLKFTQLSVLIYQALRLINDSSINDKKFYSNILRSSLHQDILFTLAINCCRKDISEMEKYKNLLEKYAFFEHMPFKLLPDKNYSMILALLPFHYQNEAFGKSDYKENLDSYIDDKIKEYDNKNSS